MNMTKCLFNKTTNKIENPVIPRYEKHYSDLAAVKVKKYTISNANYKTTGAGGNFNAPVVTNYTLTNVQAGQFQSCDANAFSFNVVGGRVYWICTRAGYGVQANVNLLLTYTRNDLIS